MATITDIPLQAQQQMALFQQRQKQVGFLVALFSPIEGSTGSTGSTVSWDVERFSNRRAKSVSPGTGMRMNSSEIFSTKRLEPCRFAEGSVVHVDDLVNREAGEDPYEAASRTATARGIRALNRGLVQAAKKIDRTMELMASQVLQTGKINIVGEVDYIKDFLPKATHFTTVALPWSNTSTSTPFFDLEASADVMQDDSNQLAAMAIFGQTAWRQLLESEQFKERDALHRTVLLSIDQGMLTRGAVLMGMLRVGTYELQAWVYTAKSEPPDGGSLEPYVAVDNVILLPEAPTLVVASTIVPRVLKPDPRLADFVSVPTVSEGGWDLVPNVWTDNEGGVLNAGFYVSAVLIPQEIDAICTIDTQAT